jgi:hypothetical protein
MQLWYRIHSDVRAAPIEARVRFVVANNNSRVGKHPDRA